MVDMSVHLVDVLMAVGMAVGGWRIAITFRDEIRSLRQTVYGSIEPPVEGLVTKVARHEEAIGRSGFLERRKP